MHGVTMKFTLLTFFKKKEPPEKDVKTCVICKYCTKINSVSIIYNYGTEKPHSTQTPLTCLGCLLLLSHFLVSLIAGVP